MVKSKEHLQKVPFILYIGRNGRFLRRRLHRQEAYDYG